MDIIIKGARPQNPSTHGGDHGPLEEMLCRPSCCLHVVAILVTDLIKTSSSATCSLQRHLASVLEKEEAKEHSAAVVAFFVGLLTNYKSQFHVEMTWKTLNLRRRHVPGGPGAESVIFPPILFRSLDAAQADYEPRGALPGSPQWTRQFQPCYHLGVLGLGGAARPPDTGGGLNTPECLLGCLVPLALHQEAAFIRRAALKQIWPLQQH
ncbi:uncharacterized protein LOC112543308 [Python bivittatus]|uniref:Uncharacterized protein LOC112543308 n=1 Tax=Python bivittatus TaxID=176946 RepID=A0A9F5N2A2_PYTBI|nr:uncharacterized protein LOC112543308 [Python bivittatus]